MVLFLFAKFQISTINLLLKSSSCSVLCRFDPLRVPGEDDEEDDFDDDMNGNVQENAQGAVIFDVREHADSL